MFNIDQDLVICNVLLVVVVVFFFLLVINTLHGRIKRDAELSPFQF